MEHICKKHGLSNHFKRKDGSFRCTLCASQWVTKNRQVKKKKLVEMFGGECSLCGYKRYVGALDFHHINQKDKKFALSVKGLCYSWESILKEAKKCIILCKNCHSEITAKVRKI